MSPVLYEMEKSGILIDSERLIGFSKELGEDAHREEKDICKLAGYDFNVGSPKQLGQVLFEKLKLLRNPQNQNRFLDGFPTFLKN